MSEEIEEFLNAVENNEYGEYSFFDGDATLITDVDSNPYVHCIDSATILNNRSIDDMLIDLGNKNGFTFQSVEFDSANSDRETKLCNQKVKIWHLEGFEVTK